MRTIRCGCLGLALVACACLPAWGQCRGGGAPPSAANMARSGGGSVGVFPAYGSGTVQYGYLPEDFAAAQMRQAYAQQQYAIAVAKAQKEQVRRDKIRQTIIAQREAELAKKGKSPGASPTMASTGFFANR